MADTADNDHSSGTRELLYHYTTLHGLLGILDTATLWATSPAYLNDTQELEYGVEMLATVLDEYQMELLQRSDAPNAAKSARILMALAKVMRDDKSRMFKHRFGQFVTCFSRSRDQLSQWRGYGQGGGYAIEFDCDVLERSLKFGNNDTLQEAFLLEVTYDWRECAFTMREAADKFIGAVLPSFPEKGDPRSTDDSAVDMWAKALSIVSPMIAALSTKMKHAKFEEEREVRALGLRKGVFYTPSPIGLIPRIELQFETAAITEILIGPGAHAEAKEASLRHYLAEHFERYGKVVVKLSEIPYRAI